MRVWNGGVVVLALTVAACGSQEAAPTLSNGRSAGDMEVQAISAVKDVLRDPGSARFGSVVVRDKPGLGVVVCGMVNAKNGFGGYTGEQPFIYAGGQAEVLPSSEDSVPIFQRYCGA